MEHKSDFLVLGGGIIGCSVAYFLSKTGASVTVLERGDTAFGTAGASGGLINWITCGETQMELFMRSQDMLEHLQEELGADFELNYNSYNMQIISNQTLLLLLPYRAETGGSFRESWGYCGSLHRLLRKLRLQTQP